MLTVYRQMAEIANATQHPLLLISYDRAMTCMEPFLRDAADFAGIQRYNFKTVRAAIRQDGVRYFDLDTEAAEKPVAKAVARSGGLSPF